MPELTNSEKAIFRAAIGLDDVAKREAFLEQACGENVALLEQIRMLLTADDVADQFLCSKAEFLDLTDVIGPEVAEHEVIGKYKLMQKIGEGGFGVVYMAEQQEPIVRKVALKIIKLGMDTRQFVARFEAERQALALMEHPHIAKVLDAGATETGRPYFVMELVRGISIIEYCDQNKLSNDQRLDLFVKVCSGIQHAHQKGVIHRDIKPSNVLVTVQDGVPVPKVIDFGIAKATQGRLTDKTLFTRFEQFIGTPAYMSPEQATLGGLEDVDTRSDIYSLGVLLYELLIGSTPFDRDVLQRGLEELRQAIREFEPQPPSTKLQSLANETLTTTARNRNTSVEQLRTSLKKDVDWIVMKALDKDRNRRYATADALASDIKRYVNGEPVAAVPPSTLYLVRKAFIRHRRAFALAGMIAILLLSATAISSWFALSEMQARNDLAIQVDAKDAAITVANLATQSAEAERRYAQQLAYSSDMQAAYQALQLNNLGLSKRLIDKHEPTDNNVDRRHWEWYWMKEQLRGDVVAMLGDRRDEVTSISISPDKRWLAIGELQGRVRILSMATREFVHELVRDESEQWGLVEFSKDGKKLFSTNGMGRIDSWDVPSFARQKTIVSLDSTLYEFALGTDVLASFSSDGFVSVTDHESGDDISRFKAAVSRQREYTQRGRIAISPIGNRFAASSYWETKLVDIGARLPLKIEQRGGRAIAFNPRGDLLAMAGEVVDASVYVYRVSDQKLLHRLEGHGFWNSAVEFAPDGKTLASAGADQTVRIWDVETGSNLAVLRGHDSEVWDMEFSDDGQTLVSAGKFGEICVWDTTAHVRRGPDRSIKFKPAESWSELYKRAYYSHASYSADSKWLAVRNRDNTVSLLSTVHSGQDRELPLLGDRNRSVLFSPQSDTLIVGDADGNLKWLNPFETAKPSKRVIAPGQEVAPISSSADGKRLLLLVQEPGRNHCLLVVSMPDGQPVAKWEIPPSEPRAAMSPSGSLVVTGHRDGTVRFWDASDPASAYVDRTFATPIEGIAFSPDGIQVVVALAGGDAAIIDAGTRTTTGHLRGHFNAVHSVVFSPDGRRILTGGTPGETVKVWDAETHRELITLVEPECWLSQVGFSPDGQTIYSITGSGGIHFWTAEAIGTKTQRR